MKRLLILCALAACGSSEEDAVEAPATPVTAPKDALAKTTETGPVKATITVWPPKPSLGDAIYARLEVEAPAGIAVDAPYQEAGDQRLGRFRIVGFVRDTEHLPGGGQKHVQTYTLEAPASGRQRIPPLRLEIVDSRAAAGSAAKQKQELLTDEVPLEIAPVPTESVGKELRPAAGTLDPDVGGVSWVVLLGIGSAALVAGAGGLLAFRGLRARKRIQARRTAYDEAVSRLRELEARGAPAAGDADTWFVALSAIVRRYLEQRYELRAPELTTEEFLQAMTARPELSAQHRDLLAAFLERCDRVKFAGYRPDSEESLATLSAARGFVEDTRLREVAA